MSDWEFLHEMHDRGYSPEEIADAAGCGMAPWEWSDLDIQLSDDPEDDVNSKEVRSPFQSRSGFPYNAIEQIQIFEDLIDCASRHFENTGRYLQVWGELGEIYAEIEFGLCRHGTHRAGSDGTIAGKLVEVKTISPEKANDRVVVKSQGNFEQLLIIRIDEHFQFEGKMIERSELKRNTGKLLKRQFKDDASDV